MRAPRTSPCLGLLRIYPLFLLSERLCASQTTAYPSVSIGHHIPARFQTAAIRAAACLSCIDFSSGPVQAAELRGILPRFLDGHLQSQRLQRWRFRPQQPVVQSTIADDQIARGFDIFQFVVEPGSEPTAPTRPNPRCSLLPSQHLRGSTTIALCCRQLQTQSDAAFRCRSQQVERGRRIRDRDHKGKRQSFRNAVGPLAHRSR